MQCCTNVHATKIVVCSSLFAFTLYKSAEHCFCMVCSLQLDFRQYVGEVLLQWHVPPFELLRVAAGTRKHDGVDVDKKSHGYLCAWSQRL